MSQKKAIKYEVLEDAKYDELGKITDVRYTVRYQYRNWIGILTWSYVKHRESSYGGSYMRRTTFKTIKEANNFVEEVLVKGTPVNTWSEKTIIRYDLEHED